MENEDQDAGAIRRPGPVTWGLMALVALITVIAVLVVPVDDRDAPPSLPELPPAPGTAEPSQQPSGPGLSGTTESSSGAQESSAAGTSMSLDLPPPPGGVATVTGGGEGARAFLYKLRASGAQPDPEVVFAEAERLQDKGDLEDAYLLYRYAARHGQAQAAMRLGTAADPAYQSAAISYLPEPAPGQAHKWYSMAAAGGDVEAGQRLEDLRGRVERAAAAGDEQAQRLLLLQWR
jgi:hypothetical protein